MLINFWTFFQGLRSLLERVMHIFFQNIHYLMVWGMPILRAMLNIFAKCSRGYVYSRVQSTDSGVKTLLWGNLNKKRLHKEFCPIMPHFQALPDLIESIFWCLPVMSQPIAQYACNYVSVQLWVIRNLVFVLDHKIEIRFNVQSNFYC